MPYSQVIDIFLFLIVTAEDNTQIKKSGRKKRKSQLNDSANDSGNVSVASTGFHDLEVCPVHCPFDWD